jgi:hypothetical protein
MIRRAVCALAVLTATIYWANCSYTTPVGGPASPVPFFLGCFKGPVTEPAGADTLIIVLEDPEATGTLGGCLRWSPGTGSLQEGTLSASVDADDSTLADATVMATPDFSVLVKRAPAGSVVATTVNVTDDGGAPFTRADNLSSCTMTCADLGFRMPFLPAGGMP